jgi:nucleotide-binding universal stress UspA family protein
MEGRTKALQDFQWARWRGDFETIMSFITGAPSQLLSFEEVRKKLRLPPSGREEIKEIPLDAIVGSVGRYTDFTWKFLPKGNIDRQRWANVMAISTDGQGHAPIEVYQVDQVYFVKDGNHRVSVAREMKAKTIQSYVTVLPSNVHLTPDITPDELFVKAEHARFLENTRLNQLRPESDVFLTEGGQYEVLEEHIAVHRYYMGIEQGREITPEEAVTHWYDTVYLPVILAIRQRGTLRGFPKRSEADLYVWISEHYAEIQEMFGIGVNPVTAASELSAQQNQTIANFLSRLGRRILDAVTPDELESGPNVGQWRMDVLSARQDERLFADILVPVSGQETGWLALEQAIMVAGREKGVIHGLHVSTQSAEQESPAALEIETRFDRRCTEAGIPGKLDRVSGDISRNICDRARWTDLIVVNLAFPPAPETLNRLGSGFRTIIRRCSRPILAVPSARGENSAVISSMQHALLAYAGSPKSEEALFAAVHLAYHWGTALDILINTKVDGVVLSSETSLTIMDKSDGLPVPLDERVRNYLKCCDIKAEIILAQGSPGELILQTAAERACDWIIMGGYEAAPLIEVFTGSTVDDILRQTQMPVLICR